MKKVKIMLTAITVMAVVGGALAFKANRFDKQFCTRAIADGTGVCQTSLPDAKITNAAPSLNYYAVETNNPVNCTTLVNPPQCAANSFFTIE